MSSSQILPGSFLERLQAAKVTTSFVVDSKGSITSAQGSSKGLGNASDLQLLLALRRHCEVVLTSGLTARVEQYKMPSSADLAIFTVQGVDALELSPKPGQRLLILSPPETISYGGALAQLLNQYSRVHIEFGPRGFTDVLERIDLVVVSSRSELGAAQFTESFDLFILDEIRLPDLFVTLAVGRGKAPNF